MMDNLVSLDRAVGALLDGLEARGLLDRAVVVFASDNGHLHGEHRITAKGVAYEESVRVPILVRGPGLTPREDTRLVAMNLDLPATLTALAGLPAFGEGVSLEAALADPTTPDARDHVFLETSVGDHPVWAGVVTERWKYVEWGSGETELYDLLADPAELDSLHAAPPADADLPTLATYVDAHRALAVTSRGLDAATVGAPYTATLAAWGGTPPLSWTLDTGALPDGVALGTDGVLAGTPTAAGAYTVMVRVTDGVPSALTGVPATFAQPLTLTVGAGASFAPPAAVVSRIVATVPTWRVLAPPGARVRVEVSMDDTRDTPKLLSKESVSDTSGVATVSLPGLDRTRAWHIQAVIDGVPVSAGVLERAP
jgi:hypothetical protein